MVKKTHKDAQMPYAATINSAKYDLYNLKEAIVKVETKIDIQIPLGYYGQIAPHSSLTLKEIQIMASIIDTDYRGKIQITLYNLGRENSLSHPDQNCSNIANSMCQHQEMGLIRKTSINSYPCWWVRVC